MGRNTIQHEGVSEVYEDDGALTMQVFDTEFKPYVTIYFETDNSDVKYRIGMQTGLTSKINREAELETEEHPEEQGVYCASHTFKPATRFVQVSDSGGSGERYHKVVFAAKG